MTDSGSGLAAVLEHVDADRDWRRGALERLVRIPSISAPSGDPSAVVRSAEATTEILRDAGLDGARLLEIDGAHPYVYGEWLGHDDAPTVLLYAHHDVQPVGTPQGWSSPPFEPSERDGRLYARGAADDKAGVLVHAAAVRAWLTAHRTLPLNVKVIIEGEEEIGSPHLSSFVEAYADLLQADVIVLTDLPNWKVGWPGLTTGLRGMGECFVEVRALRQPIHSGMYGGPVPDALTGMTRLLATLHDERGAIAVRGFADDVPDLGADERRRLERLDEDPDALHDEAGMLDGVGFVGGGGSLLERLWYRPSITPVGLDVPRVAEASNTLLAAVRAKLSCRFAPGQDPDRALNALGEHLREHAPFGMQVEVAFGERNAGWTIDPEGPAFEAAVAALHRGYGREPALMGCGGSIPFVEPFAAAFGAPCLLTGIEDPHTNAHGDDESLHLADFHAACRSEAILFLELAERLRADAG